MALSRPQLFLLVAPALVFVLFGFLVPILWFLSQTFNGQPVVDALPSTTQTIRSWDGGGMPPNAVYEALIEDLSNSAQQAKIGRLARELNFREPGYRRLILLTARQLRSDTAVDKPLDPRLLLQAIDPAWGEEAVWRTIRDSAHPFTAFHVRESLDLEFAPDGSLQLKAADERIFIEIYQRTVIISLTVTAICVLLGYPVAYLLANCHPKWLFLLMAIVLLPFWTSLLVRTLSWMVLFQREGVLNGVLLDLNLISESKQLLRTRFAVYVSMVHIMLPFIVLPLFNVMKKIPRNYMRAGESLGASRPRALATIYLPLTFPGLSAGIILVMTLSLGFYITPMLLGGGGDQMLSYLIATFVDRSLNWGLAGALGIWLMCFAFASLSLVGLSLSRRQGSA